MTTPTDPLLPDPLPDISEQPVASPAPPVPFWRRRPRWALISGGAAALVLVLCVGWVAASIDLPDAAPIASPSPTRAAPRPSPSSPFSQAAWRAFVADGSVPASVAAVIVSVSWNGVSLVAETTIVGDADAAIGVCSVLSGFWLTHGGFRPVQVVGADGGPVAHRALEGLPCSLA